MEEISSYQRCMMKSRAFTKCEKRLVEDDLSTVERALGIRFPDDVRLHYLQFNGGRPERPVWVYPDGGFDDIEVRDFIPMRYAAKFGDDPDFTAEGRAAEGWARGRLPVALFPVAFDWGGNYICVNHENGSISYFVRDVWSDRLSTGRNLEVNTRPVAGSFSEFVDGLVSGEDR